MNRLDEDFLAAKSEAIRGLAENVRRDVIEIGRHLIEAKRACGHGNWLPWLEREFGWTERTAQRFMQISELLRKNDTLSDLDLPIGSLSLLAQRSTPEEVRGEVFARAKAGEKLLPRTIRAMIEDTKREPDYIALHVTKGAAGPPSPALSIKPLREVILEEISRDIERIENKARLYFPDICEDLGDIRRDIDGRLSKPSHLKLVKE